MQCFLSRIERVLQVSSSCLLFISLPLFALTTSLCHLWIGGTGPLLWEKRSHFFHRSFSLLFSPLLSSQKVGGNSVLLLYPTLSPKLSKIKDQIICCIMGSITTTIQLRYFCRVFHRNWWTQQVLLLIFNHVGVNLLLFSSIWYVCFWIAVPIVVLAWCYCCWLLTLVGAVGPRNWNQMAWHCFLWRRNSSRASLQWS